VDDQVALSNEQLAFGLYLAKTVDRLGSAMVSAQIVHEYFGENVDTLQWLCENNLWQMKTDTLLEVVTFTGHARKDRPKRLPVQKLIRQLRQAERKGTKAFDIPCEY
jgi:hypothetical protein